MNWARGVIHPRALWHFMARPDKAYCGRDGHFPLVQRRVPPMGRTCAVCLKLWAEYVLRRWIALNPSIMHRQTVLLTRQNSGIVHVRHPVNSVATVCGKDFGIFGWTLVSLAEMKSGHTLCPSCMANVSYRLDRKDRFKAAKKVTP
jgi:hypothetical protein